MSALTEIELETLEQIRELCAATDDGWIRVGTVSRPLTVARLEQLGRLEAKTVEVPRTGPKPRPRKTRTVRTDGLVAVRYVRPVTP